MDVLGIEVERAELERWLGWCMPTVQPFLVPRDLAAPSTARPARVALHGPGTVLVWRSPDGLVEHAAVTLGEGLVLHNVRIAAMTVPSFRVTRWL